MFKRRLQALEYEEYDKVDANDLQHVKKLVSWLENQKIRHYKIDDRGAILDIESQQWPATYEKYLEDVGCPQFETPLDKVEWLVGLAIRLEYEDNLQSEDFKKGVSELAKLLNIPQHPNHLITLEACSKFICKRLNEEAVKNPGSVIVTGQPFPIMDTNAGFKIKDPFLNKAVTILSLLYIQDLRDLQTKINEAIVSVQTITANPKTDHKLGKVGK
ncbi:unnamed protein product [Trichogramma brassicae]|uniref:RNA transcription, translation and transport factor protein n=1 Tax=Trichogramma brassicae TaxID=86971 RepID=A0A6H5I459_9HYME|nr:unnamed protein product [Trichogramma brassicae]